MSKVSGATGVSARRSTTLSAKLSTRRQSCLGLGYPGGPAVERAAASGNAKRFELPRSMIGRAEAHFSFAGLKTALRHRAEAAAPLKEQDIADLCAAFEAAVCDQIVDRVRRAMELAEDIGGPGSAAASRGGRRSGRKQASQGGARRRGSGARICAPRAAGRALHRQRRHDRVGRRRATGARPLGSPRFRVAAAVAARSGRAARHRRGGKGVTLSYWYFPRRARELSRVAARGSA